MDTGRVPEKKHSDRSRTLKEGGREGVDRRRRRGGGKVNGKTKSEGARRRKGRGRVNEE